MPAIPFGIVVIPGTNFANINWYPVADANMYAVIIDGTIHSPILTNSVTVSNLQPNARHEVQVASHSNSGWSSYSSPVAFTL